MSKAPHGSVSVSDTNAAKARDARSRNMGDPTQDDAQVDAEHAPGVSAADVVDPRGGSRYGQDLRPVEGVTGAYNHAKNTSTGETCGNVFGGRGRCGGVVRHLDDESGRKKCEACGLVYGDDTKAAVNVELTKGETLAHEKEALRLAIAREEYESECRALGVEWLDPKQHAKQIKAMDQRVRDRFERAGLAPRPLS